MVKLDFANAFNSIRRDCMLEAVQSQCPAIYSFVYSNYATPSTLLWGDKCISSGDGVQQGDPLGPLLFCLTLHQHGLRLKSQFSVLYLDDVTLGGELDDLIHDLDVMRDAAELGLGLNPGKCEIISHNMNTHSTLLVSLPGVLLLPPSKAQLLGSLLGDDASISEVLSHKTSGGFQKVGQTFEASHSP